MAKDATGKKQMPFWVKAIIIVLSVIIGILLIVCALVYRKWQRADYLTADMFKANTTNPIPVVKINELDESADKKVKKTFQLLKEVKMSKNGIIEIYMRV